MELSDKIEPRLLKEISRLETAGQPDLRISVLLELVHELDPLRREGTAEVDKATEGRLRVERRNLLERLARMAAGKVPLQLELANALEMQLTPAQIRQVAAHPDVKRIIWNREERVTA